MEPLKGREGSATVAVITVIGEELAAAREILGLNQNIQGTPHYVSAYSPERRYGVVLTKCSGRGNIPAAAAVRSLVEDYRPHFLLLVGIAGGVSGRDGVGLGDVVLADYIEYSEYMKIAAGGWRIRREPHDHPSLYLRARVAEPQGALGGWTAKLEGRPRPNAGTSKLLVGTIVAGEKILGDPDNEYQQEVLDFFDKALAVEMEAMGFVSAIFESRSSVHYNPQCLVIRGISDLVDVVGVDIDATRAAWKQYAAFAAAAFGASVTESLLALHHSHQASLGLFGAISRKAKSWF